MLRELELRIQIIIAFNDVISYHIIKNGASQSLRAPFTFITNTNSNYSNKWKKRKSLTITKRMQI